ncbi:MAG: ABC transporter ATP-binding protein [Armatimonadetes bacterium]|nr:ABC transporter ATP-binding protein [Armatimonadota bacterium]
MRLEVCEGEFGYKAGEALFENLSFSLEAGEILTILGPNGAGKTTLIKCLTGILKWRKGQTIIDGQALDYGRNGEVWKKIGYVPQGHSVVFPYTVLEMVLMGRAPHLGLFRVPSARDVAVARKALEVVEASHLADKPCSRISGGEMQLVLIARALASEPRVLVLDEPESHLDFKNQMLVLGLLEKLAKERGISCLINTHYPEHALWLSDQTLMLGKGKRHLVGRTKEVVTEDNLRSFFGIKARILSFNGEGKEMLTVVPFPLAEQVG